jgi:hypothetical protein
VLLELPARSNKDDRLRATGQLSALGASLGDGADAAVVNGILPGQIGLRRRSANFGGGKGHAMIERSAACRSRKIKVGCTDDADILV